MKETSSQPLTNHPGYVIIRDMEIITTNPEAKMNTSETYEARMWDSEKRNSPYSTVCDPDDETCECCGYDPCKCESQPDETEEEYLAAMAALGYKRALPLMDANSDNPLEASIARLRTEAKMIPFLTTNLDELRTLRTESLEWRLAIQRAAQDPLRYRSALKTVLDERENLDHIVCEET